MKARDKYDVIIVGAGIGGLVCGCYLARAGMKVLIVEKNDKPGGYCVSYKRDKFLFDAGPHSLGSCRKNGQLGRLFEDFGLNKSVKLIRKNPTNIIVTPDCEVIFYNNIPRTLNGIQRLFPKEAGNINRFFNLLNVPNIGFLYSKLKDMTFSDLLDEYFSDYKLKAVFSIVLGNLGLSPSWASAFTSSILYREHIFDGGYYPVGGIQVFSDALADKFKEYGGIIMYSSTITGITVKGNQVKGVRLHNDNVYKSEYVISNSDAYHTYFNLIGTDYLDKRLINKISRLMPSLSFFMVHIGLKHPIVNRLTNCSTLWYFPSYDINDIYEKVRNGKLDLLNKYIVFGFPGPYKKSSQKIIDVLSLVIMAPFKNPKYWQDNKASLTENLIDRAKVLFPDLPGNIATLSTTSPQDFYNYTFNRCGGISGWASMPSQIKSDVVPMQSPIRNLLLTGHWATNVGGQGGVPMVVYSGRSVAKHILNTRKGK
ncbi:MAG: NAD(P)/FAD-dependent oxidoreductase [Candidatus Omnitrophota bacterium]|jgi:prolycopene isomerase